MMGLNPNHFHHPRHPHANASEGTTSQMTVEQLFNPLLGLWNPPISSAAARRANNKRDIRHCVTIGQLFNPLLDLEQLQENRLRAGAPSSVDNVASSISSISHYRQIELSSFSSLESLASEGSQDDDDDDHLELPAGKRRVRFSDDDNVVHWIPSHRDYPRHEFDSIWSNPDEIEYNASRNRIEFRYEGGNWRTVLEETKFVLCSDGQLYHPITVHLFLQQLQREEAIRLVVRKRKVVVPLTTSLLSASSSSSRRNKRPRLLQ